jgi:hypothetical protein
MTRENGRDIKPPTHHERREQAKLAWPLVWPRHYFARVECHQMRAAPQIQRNETHLGISTTGVALRQHPGIVRNQPKAVRLIAIKNVAANWTVELWLAIRR